jgi:NADH-quinone oxidoreductase subunit E
MALSAELIHAIQSLAQKYPVARAALIPALHLIQEQHGFISVEHQEEVAALLDVPPTRVVEVVTFYTMFTSEPKGKHVVKICRNLPCKLRGADALMACAEAHLGIKVGETTQDGQITLEHEECLASCGTAPMLWCDGRFVENINEAKLVRLLTSLSS